MRLSQRLRPGYQFEIWLRGKVISSVCGNPRCSYSGSQGTISSPDTVVPAFRSEELRGNHVWVLVSHGPARGCLYHFLLSPTHGGKYDMGLKKKKPQSRLSRPHPSDCGYLRFPSQPRTKVLKTEVQVQCLPRLPYSPSAAVCGSGSLRPGTSQTVSMSPGRLNPGGSTWTPKSS